MIVLFVFLVNDACSPDPCKNRGLCQVLRLNSYYCACPEGWTGPHCEQGNRGQKKKNGVKFAWEMFVTERSFPLFLDVKECSMADNVCQNGGTCDERMGYYICNCQLGFAGKNCTKGMADSFSINCTHMKCVFLHTEH